MRDSGRMNILNYNSDVQQLVTVNPQVGKLTSKVFNIASWENREQ